MMHLSLPLWRHSSDKLSLQSQVYTEASGSHDAHAVMANTVNYHTPMLPEGFVLLGEGQIPSCEIPISTPTKKTGERVKNRCMPEVSPLEIPEGPDLVQKKIP